MKDILVNKLITGEQPKMRVIFTGGGEPTYDWTLFESVVTQLSKKAVRNNIEYEIELTTNGILSEKNIEFIANYVTRVMLSFDGLPEMQNRNRRVSNGSSSFDIVDPSIRALNRYGVPLHIRSTVWRHDIEYLRDMAEYICDNYDFLDWSVMPAMPQGRVLNTQNDNSSTDDDFFLNT